MKIMENKTWWNEIYIEKLNYQKILILPRLKGKIQSRKLPALFICAILKDVDVFVHLSNKKRYIMSSSFHSMTFVELKPNGKKELFAVENFDL